MRKGQKTPEYVKEKIRLANLGKKHKVSPDGYARIIAGVTGNKHSLEFKEKCRLAWTGENNPNYIDGKSKLTNRHYADSRLKDWRLKVFKRDNWTCQKCQKMGCYLEAHHILGWVQYPEFRYELSNGQTLCKECHRLTDNYKAKGKKKNLTIHA